MRDDTTESTVPKAKLLCGSATGSGIERNWSEHDVTSHESIIPIVS
jgi:hypothetical protein